MMSYTYIPKKIKPYKRGQGKNYNFANEHLTDEAPTDDDIYNNCIFCGKPFNKDVHRNIVNYPNYSYAVCDSCYQLYLC